MTLRAAACIEHERHIRFPLPSPFVGHVPRVDGAGTGAVLVLVLVPVLVLLAVTVSETVQLVASPKTNNAPPTGPPSSAQPSIQKMT